MRIVVRLGMAAVWVLVPAVTSASDPILDDHQTLKAAHISTDAPALFEFFRTRAATQVDADKLKASIQAIGGESAEVQNRAFGEIISLGTPMIVELRRAANDLDHPVRAQNARKCLTLLESDANSRVVHAAARILVEERTPGAIECLLDYLPHAEDEDTVREIERALAIAFSRPGPPDPAILRALSDPRPICRLAAASAICQANDANLYEHVRPLLHDPKPTIRLRVALGLAKKNDAEAVPVLIQLLSELPTAQIQPVIEFLTQLSGEWAVSTPSNDDPTSRRLRRELWTTWWSGTDGVQLLEEFRRRTMTDEQRQQVSGWIRALGHADASVRDQAVTQLVAAGASAAPLLRQGLGDDNPQVKTWARHCLERIHGSESTPMSAVAARLVALRKPAGAVEALLNYLPCAESDVVIAEVQNALGALALHDNKADPVLRKALADPSPVRRAAAAEAFCRAGLGDQRTAVHAMLKDADASVRLRTALALVAAHDKEAVPVLIATLTELPADQSWQAEEALIRIAGDKAPSGSALGDAEARTKYRDAWANWWQEHGAAVDLGQFDRSQGMLGLTLVVEQQSRRAGRVLELDSAGKVRWQISGLQHPIDAQAIAGDRVLIVEMQGMRVTERDRAGKILWQRSTPNPISCRRLPNGQTFIAMRHQLLVVDRNGNEVLNHAHAQANIAAAARTRDGHFVYVTYEGLYVELDAAGKELKSAPVPFLQNFAQFIEFLPNEKFLVAMYGNNKVAEYDLTGKIHWEANVPTPSSAQRLPNGRTLVVSATQRVLELDRAGQTVWEVKEKIRPWKARRR